MLPATAIITYIDIDELQYNPPVKVVSCKPLKFSRKFRVSKTEGVIVPYVIHMLGEAC